MKVYELIKQLNPDDMSKDIKVSGHEVRTVIVGDTIDFIIMPLQIMSDKEYRESLERM